MDEMTLITDPYEITKIFVDELAGTWLDETGYRTEAETIRSLPPYTEENLRKAIKAVDDSRKPLRAKRLGIKHLCRTSPHYSWDAYEVSWAIGRGLGFDEATRALRDLNCELSKNQTRIILASGHVSRACIWSLAWTQAIDQGEDLDKSALWDIFTPTRNRIHRQIREKLGLDE